MKKQNKQGDFILTVYGDYNDADYIENTTILNEYNLEDIKKLVELLERLIDNNKFYDTFYGYSKSYILSLYSEEEKKFIKDKFFDIYEEHTGCIAGKIDEVSSYIIIELISSIKSIHTIEYVSAKIINEI